MTYTVTLAVRNGNNGNGLRYNVSSGALPGVPPMPIYI